MSVKKTCTNLKDNYYLPVKGVFLEEIKNVQGTLHF